MCKIRVKVHFFRFVHICQCHLISRASPGIPPRGGVSDARIAASGARQVSDGIILGPEGMPGRFLVQTRHTRRRETDKDKKTGAAVIVNPSRHFRFPFQEVCNTHAITLKYLSLYLSIYIWNYIACPAKEVLDFKQRLAETEQVPACSRKEFGCVRMIIFVFKALRYPEAHGRVEVRPYNLEGARDPVR